MALLSKDQIFAMDDMRYTTVEVGNGEIRLKSMSISDQLSYEKELTGSQDHNRDLVFGLIVRCCVDENGNQLFTKDDLDLLGKKSTDFILKVFNAAKDLNDLKQDDLEKHAKNS